MINGGHLVIHSRDADADRALFRHVLGLRSVDAGGGWLLFALPPCEAAFHPSEHNDRHELYLMCDDLDATVAELAGHGVECSAAVDEPWGSRSALRLPGGGELGLYQPKHPKAI